MNEQQIMLSDMADGLFAQLADCATAAPGWAQVDQLALTSLLVSEDDGGFGGTWDDARIVFRLAGYHALALPVVEAIVASRVATPLGFEGRGAIASRAEGSMVGERFSGTVAAACEVEDAAYVVFPHEGRALVVRREDAKLMRATTVSGEARPKMQLDDVAVGSSDEDLAILGAFARTSQIAGALDAALARSVNHANERQQFGRPLGKFQAVQQSLASFACEAAAANCAAIGAAQALDRGDGALEVAFSKLRANEAVGIGAAIAHQVHGAIGFTQEYPLHRLTRRLWTWRSEFGEDAYWADRIGHAVLSGGAEAFWPDLTARTDSV